MSPIETRNSIEDSTDTMTYTLPVRIRSAVPPRVMSTNEAASRISKPT